MNSKNSIDKDINGHEFQVILRLHGTNQQEFADFAGRSKAFVTERVISAQTVPRRYVDDLIELIGADNYKDLLNKIRQVRYRNDV